LAEHWNQPPRWKSSDSQGPALKDVEIIRTEKKAVLLKARWWLGLAAQPGHELKQDRNLIQDGEDLGRTSYLRNTASGHRRNRRRRNHRRKGPSDYAEERLIAAPLGRSTWNPNLQEELVRFIVRKRWDLRGTPLIY
jgi:hypothetical protein